MTRPKTKVSTIQQLKRYFVANAWIIVTAMLLCAVGGRFVCNLLRKPMYCATTQILIHQMPEAGLESDELRTSVRLQDDCIAIITGSGVLNEVADRLGLSEAEAEWKQGLSVEPVSETRILNVSYTDADPEKAARIVNTVREVSTERINSVIGTDVVRTIYEADIPREAVDETPRQAFTTVMGGAAAGVVASSAILLAMFLVKRS